MTGYRTYIFLGSALLMKVLNTFGVEVVTTEQLDGAIEIILLLVAGIFHMVHKSVKVVK